MKRKDGYTKRIFIPASLIAIVLVGAFACGKPVPDKATEIPYQLTHSAADVEYIISWDTIVSRCPDTGEYDKQESFLYRGESKQTSAGGTSTMADDSPTAWSSRRLVMASPTSEVFRGLGIWISFFETNEYLEEYIEQMKLQGLPLKQDGDYMTAVLESGPPTKSLQIHLAGKNFYVLIMETASSEESFFLARDELMGLLPKIKGNISSLAITALPPDIPKRVEKVSYEWREYMISSSKELPPPVRVPEGQQYNDLIFSDRPLMQIFSFIIDKDWRFVMTATGEIGTKFEAYITVSTMGEEGFSYSTDQVFSLYEETVTFTREQPLEERYEPPVNVEFKLFYDNPMDWVIRIEK